MSSDVLSPDVPASPTRPNGYIAVSRHFDVGYAIDLAATRRLVPASAIALSSAAESVSIADPFLVLTLPAVDVKGFQAACSARVFAFGSICLRLVLPITAESVEDFASQASALTALMEKHPCFALYLESLAHGSIAGAITKPVASVVDEDYTVFRLDSSFPGFTPDKVAPSQVLSSLLLGELRPVTPEALSSLVSPRYSYYPDEVSVFSWDRGLVVAPGVEETDVEILVQWANAHLLELRVYDAALDTSIRNMYEAKPNASASKWGRLISRHDKLVSRVQQDIAEISEVVERVENAIKFTDDIYLSRVYGGILEAFRVKTWRAVVDRKLRLMQDTASIMHDAAASRRSEYLEIAIVALFVADIALSLIKG